MSSPFSACCFKGFEWSGTPTGKDSKLASNDTYVTGSNSDVAIMVIADLFGWTFVNERLLCDHYAAEADATVYLPDFFGGQVLPLELAKRGPPFAGIDMETWAKRNSKEVRWPELLACAQALRSQYKRVGIIGYCYGGWSSFRLGAESLNPKNAPLVDCISAAHPTWLTKEEVDAVGVPTQMIDSEVDPRFHEEVRPHLLQVVPKKGLPFDWQFFPGVEHSFATRGDENDERKDVLWYGRRELRLTG